MVLCVYVSECLSVCVYVCMCRCMVTMCVFADRVIIPDTQQGVAVVTDSSNNI